MSLTSPLIPGLLAPLEVRTETPQKSRSILSLVAIRRLSRNDEYSKYKWASVAKDFFNPFTSLWSLHYVDLTSFLRFAGQYKIGRIRCTNHNFAILFLTANLIHMI